MDSYQYWFDEGGNAFKSGIEIPELDRHFPAPEMSVREWKALEQGWFAQHLTYLEQMGQTRLF